MKIKTICRRGISALLVLIMMLTTFSFTGCFLFGGEDKKESVIDPCDDNYRTFYQIFVGSFSDGNGDGFGDLQGIINRMDYLNDGDINNGDDLGVQGIWLSPIFSSPSYHKYDTKDYYTIDSRFGDEETLKELIDLCHERNVKIILDLVLNHTSKEHPWFTEFKKARREKDTESKYYDWYSCALLKDQVAGKKYNHIPGSDYYYECNFSTDMPELNYDNPDVREAMLDVAKYYLELGIDGFRFDAIKYIYGGESCTTEETAKSAAFWEWYMDKLRSEYPEIYTVGECWSGDNEILKYYGAMNCFDFSMSGAEGKVASAAKGGRLSSYTNYVTSFISKIKSQNPDGMLVSFLSNHDQDRIGGAFYNTNQAKMAASLYLLCSGSPVIYYGEEIGMRGARSASSNTDADRRLAMLWGDDDKVRDPSGSTYNSQIDSSVSQQLKEKDSLLKHYSELLSIRQRYPAIARGEYSAISIGSTLGGFFVTYNDENLAIIHNTSTEEIKLELSKISVPEGCTLAELCECVGAGNASLEGTTLTISGLTSVILK